MIPKPVSIGLLKCPRCNGPLKEFQGHGDWMRYFRCDGCVAAFRFESGELVQGRKKFGDGSGLMIQPGKEKVE